MKKSIEYNAANVTKLAEYLCDFRTKREAFNFFGGSQYTFEQVKYFYIKYKEDIESRRKLCIKCPYCGKYFFPATKTNKKTLSTKVFNVKGHSGFRRFIDTVLSFGKTEKKLYNRFKCTYCDKFVFVEK